MPYRVHYHRRDVAGHGHFLLWLLFRCLPATVITGWLLLMLSASPARAKLADWPAADMSATPDAGHMVLRDEENGQSVQAVLLSSKVHFDISGMVATAVLEQRFRNDTDRWLEGLYAFPLPENAAVRYLEMAVGERRIIGKVREREQASAMFEQAKRDGRKASLVEQQRPNQFETRLALGLLAVIT